MTIKNMGAAGRGGARHLGRVSRGFVGSAAVLAALLIAAAGSARAADPPAAPAAGAPPAARTFTDGQKVEVREGDTWSPATILKREGRKYQVRYDGGDASTDEWVTADRLRAPGTTGAAAAGAPPAPAAGKPPAGAAADKATATGASAKPPVKPTANWPLRSAAEVKWGGNYRKATIINKRGDWYLINYENGPFEEWVEPWRIRKVGSTDNPYGYAKPNPAVRKGQPSNPPTEQPGPPPEPAGGAARAGGGGAAGGAGGDNKSIENEHTPISPADRAGIRDTVIGGGAVDTLKLAPDAEAKPAKPTVQQPIVLQGSTGEFFDHNKGIYFTGAEAGLVATVHSNEPPGKPADVRVERIELSTGRSMDSARLPVSCEPLDVSPDGRLFLARSNVWGFGGSARLDVWQLGAGGPEAKHVVSFVPFDTQQPANRDIKWARFADADHVIAMSGNGLVALFDVRSGAAKAVWSAEAEAQATPALSANGKYLAVGIKGNEIAIVETATGRTLGRLGVDSTWGLRLSFKPDGAQLAAAAQDQLTIWDLATGKHAYDLTPVGATGSQIAWPADGFVLLDGQYLVALDKKMTVWTYEAGNGQPAPQGTTYGGRYWYVAGGAQGGKPALVSAGLPDEPARRAAAAASPENDLLVRPGSTVSLDVRVVGEIQEKSTAGIRQRLKENGVTIADNAPVKLVARTEPGETRQIEYRAFGAGAGGTSKVSATGTKYLIALQTADGKVLWERKIATSPPPMLMMKQGQTVDQAVAEAMKPSPAFFEAKIPRYVPKNRNGAGTSRLGPAGVQSAGPAAR